MSVVLMGQSMCFWSVMRDRVRERGSVCIWYVLRETETERETETVFFNVFCVGAREGKSLEWVVC